MTHIEYIFKNFTVLAYDSESKSILFYAYGDVCCEINGQAFRCSSEKEFWELVNYFKGETFEE
jgi:hypothetical protein